MLGEPTNDLDIETLTVLEDFLDSWPGTLVVVTHDRYFLERVTDATWALRGDGQVSLLPGGVDQYLAERSLPPAEGSLPPVEGSLPPVEGSLATIDPAAQRAARKTVERVERQLVKVAAQETELHRSMASAASDVSRLSSLDAELRELHARKEELEAEWLEAAELLG